MPDVSALVAAGAALVAIWQAYEARKARKGTEDQADSSRGMLKKTEQQIAAADKAATSAMLSVGAAERAASAAEDQVVLARHAVKAAEVQAESARQQVIIMLDQLAEQRADRRERLEGDQRQALVDVLKTGRQWVEVMKSFVLVHNALLRWDDSERSLLANRFQETLDAYKASLVHAQFAVTDHHMAMLVDVLDGAIGLWPEVADRLSKTSRDDEGVADINDTGYALGMHRMYDDLLSAVQKIAVRRFAA